MQPPKEEMQRYISKLSEEWKGRVCDLCGKSVWEVLGTVFNLTEYGQKRVRGSYVAPVIAIECQTCGNTRLINAITIGLVPPDEDEPKGGGNA